MESNAKIDTKHEEEIDLKEIISALWAGSRTILTITILFAVMSVLYALSLPNQYKATALLAPAQSDSSDLSGALGQLGGFASLAGVDIGGGNSSEGQIAQEIMKSWSFIEEFITKNNLSIKLTAVKEWNKESNELQIDDNVYDERNNQWLIEDEYGVLGPPSSWSLFEDFSDRLAISEDKTSGLVSVSIEYYSPHIAKKWLDMYVAAINEHMQQRQVEKVTNNINYLQVQIDKTSIAEMREVFYTIIEEQTKNKMLAEANPDYVFVPVSPIMVPELKSQPQRAIICIMGTLLGVMLSVFWVLIMYYARKPS